MLGKTPVLGFLFIVGSSAFTAAQAGDHCTNLSKMMEPSTLYIATCSNANPNCLAKVEQTTGSATYVDAKGQRHLLGKGRSYRFLYKTGGIDALNSLVVVRMKRVESNPTPKPLTVQLRRKTIPFGCVGFRNRKEAISSWPGGLTRGAVYSAPYDKYDQFHRYGSTSHDEDEQLRYNFHVNYFNGSTCHGSLDFERRGHFLFEDVTNVKRNWTAFFYWLGGRNPPFSTQLTKESPDLRVILTRYKQSPSSPGCFSFSTSFTEKTVRFELGLSDLELLARGEWIFDVE